LTPGTSHHPLHYLHRPMHYTVPAYLPAYLPACCVSPCLALCCPALLCVQPSSLPYLTSPSVPTYLPTYLPTLLTYPLLFPIPSSRLGSHASRPVTARHKTGPSQNGAPRFASPRFAIDSSPLSKTLHDSPTIHRLSHDSKQRNIASSNSLPPTASLTEPSSHPT
jgi:hypothetical protein